MRTFLVAFFLCASCAHFKQAAEAVDKVPAPVKACVQAALLEAITKHENFDHQKVTAQCYDLVSKGE